MICSECTRPIGLHGARGYCPRHYQRWRKHGDSSTVLPSGNTQGRLWKRTLNQEYFDDINTSERAYWLGFFTADGCVQRREHSYLISLCLKESDKDHVQLFCDALGADHPLRFREDTNTVRVTIGSKRMVESLERLGVTPRKSLTAQPWVGPESLMSHYWRGLFDGDGTIYHSTAGWFLGIVGSLACVEAFADWARLVSGSKAKYSKASGCWVWKVCGGPMPQLLAKALYEDAPVALPRKRARAEDLMAINFSQHRRG